MDDLVEFDAGIWLRICFHSGSVDSPRRLRLVRWMACRYTPDRVQLSLRHFWSSYTQRHIPAECNSGTPSMYFRLDTSSPTLHSLPGLFVGVGECLVYCCPLTGMVERHIGNGVMSGEEGRRNSTRTVLLYRQLQSPLHHCGGREAWPRGRRCNYCTGLH